MQVNYAWPSYIYHTNFVMFVSQDNCFVEKLFFAQTIKVKILIKVIVVKEFSFVKQQQNP